MEQQKSLEELPVELLTQIMLCLDGIDDLYNLICASPHIYRVFCTNKSSILTSVARESFHPSSLLNALSLARLAELKPSRRPLPPVTARALLQIPLEDRQQRLLANNSALRATGLCKLERLLRFFIDDYARNTLSILAQHGKGQFLPIETEYCIGDSAVMRYHLSTSEVARLQRALSCFELYAQLFSTCSGDRLDCPSSPKDPVTIEQQVESFLCELSCSELVEVHCIRDYLFRRLRSLLDQVEDDAVAAPQPDYYEQANASCANGRDVCPNLFRYHSECTQKDNIEHLMSLGLCYLRRIFRATGEERIALMLHGSDTCCVLMPSQDFITDALELSEKQRRSSKGGYVKDARKESNALV